MIDLFKNINEIDKEKILKLLEANTFIFKKDTYILSKIKSDNIIGIVVYGYIQIIKTDYNGNVTIIEKLEDNSVFGSMFSNISNDEYQIITKDETKIIIIDYDRIMENTNNDIAYNTFIQNLLKIVSNKIQEKNDRIEILTEKTIRNKLLKYFQITSKRNGSKNIYLPFTLTELAEYIAVDRCAMSREIKNLKEDNIIEINNKIIKINII
jgi:CRP-like cAMP-binding protein